MRKSKALELLGGTAAAAKAIGVSYQAVEKWPDPLPNRIADRVIAAVARQRPTDWHRIWPELVTPEHPAPASETTA